MLTVLYSLKSSVIQNKFIKRITKEFSEKYETDISIKSSKISFEEGIILEEILLNDRFNDTLIFIKKLNTNLSSFEKLIEGNIRLSDLNIDGLILNIKNHSKNQINSLEFLINSIRSNNNSSKIFPSIFISNLKLKNSKIRHPKLRHSFTVNDLSSTNLLIGPDYIESSSLNGKFELNQNQKFILDFNSFQFLGCSLSTENYSLISDYGELNGAFSLSNNKGSLFDDNINSNINSKNRLSNFIPYKFGFKTDSLKILSAEFDLSGSLDSISFKKVKLDLGFSEVNSEFNVTNLFSNKENIFSGNIIADDIAINDLNEAFKSSTIPLKIFKEQRIRSLKLKGTFSLSKWNFNIDLKTSLGNVIGDTKKNSNISNLSSFFLNIYNMNLSDINSSFPNGLLSADLNIKITDDNADWILSKGVFVGNKMKPINFLASGIGNFAKGNIIWEASKGLRVLPSKIDYDFSNKINQISSILNLSSLNLSDFNNKIGNGKAELSGILKSKIEVESIDEASLILTVQDLKIKHKNGTLSSSDFYVNSFLKNQSRNFSIINSTLVSGEAVGKFDLSKIKPLVNNALAETFPIIPKLKLSKDQNMSFDFTLSKDLVNILNPDIQSKEDFILSGYLSNENYKSFLNIEVPFFQYLNFYAQDLKINIDNKSSNRDSQLLIGKIIYNSSNLGSFSLLSKRYKNNLLVSTQLNSLEEGDYGFDLNFIFDKLTDSRSVFRLTDSSILYNGFSWTLEGSKQKNIIYDFNKNSVEVKNFEILSDKSQIEFKGYFNNYEDYDFGITIKNLKLKKILNQNKYFNTQGNINSNWEIKRSNIDNNLNGYLKSSDIIVNKILVGDLEFKIKGNNLLKSYLINLNVIKNLKETFSGKGSLILDSKISKVDLDVLLSDFDISFLSSLGKKSLSNIYGQLNGNFNIWGDFSNLQTNGQVNLVKSGFSIPYVNTDYTLSNDSKIKFDKNVLLLLPTEISNKNFKTKSNLTAEFSHSSFKNWNMNLNVNSEGLLLLDKKKTPDALFYGKGFFLGQILMSGSTKNPQLELFGSTAPGTSIKIPWRDTQELTDLSFIKFVDKKAVTNENNINEKIQDIKESRGLEMFFELDINNDAEVEIVIDQSSGSFLSGRGNGRLLMETNTKGKFNIFGNFTTTEGIYNFKNFGILDKKFDLEQGGTIVWDGNPLGAQMNLNALYEVPGGANPALLLDNPNFNKKIPTNVGINLQGNLLKPDNPNFEISFPNTNATVVSEINYRLLDPQTRQLQAISLLSQGIFINDVSLSVQGITNNLYEKASDLFNSIIGDSDEKLKVGINYLKGDKNNNLDVFSEDRLGLTLSTQVSDKILINGKIGVPIGGVNETLIVGDVQIDFILNEDGSLKAKVFNKENEFRYIGDKLGYTQGMGLSYNVDFNNFKELINLIIKESNK